MGLTSTIVSGYFIAIFDSQANSPWPTVTGRVYTIGDSFKSICGLTVQGIPFNIWLVSLRATVFLTFNRPWHGLNLDVFSCAAYKNEEL